jgi:transglutaminase-like putative cysteine protease
MSEDAGRRTARRATGRTARRPGSVLRRGWRSPVATAVIAVATVVSLGALSGVLAPGAWRWHVALAVAGTAAVTATVRAFTRSVVLPTLIGLVLAVYGLQAWYATPPGASPFLPDAGTLSWAQQLVDQAATLIETSVVPMTVWPPVEMLIAAAAVLVFLAADLLAVGCGVPALSGLALVAVWTPGVVLGYPGSTWALAGTSFCYLLLLALGHAPVSHLAGGRRAGAVLAGSAALVAVTLAAGPVVAAAPVWSWVDLPDLGTGAVGPVRLSDDLDLRDSLRQQSNQVVLRYSVEDYVTDDDPGTDRRAATAGLVGPLRSFTLRDFDGRAWEREAGASLSDWDPDALLTSDPGLLGTRLDATLGTLVEVDVEVGALREQRLPISTAPRTVAIEGSWQYDTARDEIVGRDRTDATTTYTMVVQVPDLTPELLRAAEGDLPEEVQDYLTVPETEHSADVRALAEQLTAGAATAYDQAMALQTYFRSSTQFRYDTSVAEATSDDAVWDFLQSRRGYCVQFATSMTVMARMLGIPARLGVGFLPGDIGSDGMYSITGADAHAWPELYFPGTGWVRFEPTPAVQTGPPPSWSNPLAAAAGASAAPTEQAARPTTDASATPSSTSTTAAGAEAGTGTGTTGSTPVALVVLGTLALAGLVAGAVALLRRRRPPARLTPEVAWARLHDRLRRAGVGWSDAHTPRQAVAAVRTALTAARGRPLDNEADRALVALADAVERDRYTPQPEAVDEERLQGWIGAVLRDVSSGSSAGARGGAGTGDGDGAEGGAGATGPSPAPAV